MTGWHGVALLAWLVCTGALAQGQPQAQAYAQVKMQTQGEAAWWLGFVDARDHAFLELPADMKKCATRADVLKRAGATKAGTVLDGPYKAEALVPRGARLTFGVTDLEGRYSERVLPRVAAIVRDDEHPKGACWHLAEAGTEAPGYQAEEELIAFGTLPPRRLTVRNAGNGWKSYGATPAQAGADARFADMEGAPPAWRARVASLLPGYTQVYGQGFEAVLSRGGAPQSLTLIGAINDGPGTGGKGEAYNTLNLIVYGNDGAPLYGSGPSGGVVANRSGSFVAQAVAAVDLDGDGIDEIVLRARYFEGGNLKVLKLIGARLVEIRQSAYEGE